MSDTPGSLIRHAAAAACLLMIAAGGAAAQSPAPTPDRADFLSRAEYHLSSNVLAIENDQRFSWDAYFGGEVDMFDYIKGRTSIIADYHAVLGQEYRPFDPNQAYYVLEVSSSYRAPVAEVAFIFHHVSRHISDRPKQFAIAWNVAGVRVMRHLETNGFTFDLRADGGAIVQHSYVDYKWTANADVMIRRAIKPRVGVFVHGSGELFTVDGSVPNRGSQNGGRFEAGLRLNGRAGALELFAGIEQRLDADPIDRERHQFGIAGFRLLSR